MSVFRPVFIAITASANPRTADATTTTVFAPQRKPLVCYLLDFMVDSLLNIVLRCTLLFPSLDDQVRLAIIRSLTQDTARTHSSRESEDLLDLLMSSPPPSLAKYPLLEARTVSSGNSSESDSLTGTSCSLTSDGLLCHPLLEPPVPRVAPTGLAPIQATSSDANFQFVFTESDVDGKDGFALDGGLDDTEVMQLCAAEHTVYDNPIARRVAQLGYEVGPATDTVANVDPQEARPQPSIVQQPCFVLDVSADTMAAADSVLQSLLGPGPTPAPPTEIYRALPALPLDAPQFTDAHGTTGLTTVDWQWPAPDQVPPEDAASPPFASDSDSQAQDDDSDSDSLISPWGPVESTTRLYPHIMGLLGEGGFGRVLLASLPEKDNALVALKVHHKAKLFREPGTRSALRLEQIVLQIVTDNRLPFACHLLQSWETHEDIYFMMRMYPSDMLKEIDNHRMSPQEMRIRAAEMATGLCDLHHLGIVHRDLKPENILVAPNGSIVIADFGLSTLQDPTVAPDQWQMNDPVGTIGYMAPELLCGDVYSAKVDIFALGVIFWQMFADTSIPIWDSMALDGCEEQLRAMQNFPVARVLGTLAQKGVDPLLIDLIKGMLDFDQRYRLTAKQVAGHPFFNDINWNKLYARHKDYSFERQPQCVVPRRIMLDPGFAAWHYPRPADMRGSDGQLRREWKDVELDTWGRIINNHWANQQMRESGAQPDEFLYLGYFEDKNHGHVGF